MNVNPKIPVDPNYVSVLGRAVYNFSYLEWGIVWLIETLSPDFLKRVGGMTAGMIANEFEIVSGTCSDADAGELQALASTFKLLVLDRNALVHGVPYTSANGEQRLLHIGASGRRDWSIQSIADASQRFEEAAIIASHLLHPGRYEAYSETGRSLSI